MLNLIKMENNIKISVEGQELTIREGKALELKEPQKIGIVGNSFTASTYLKGRKINVADSFIQVDRENGTIELKENASSFYSNSIKSVLKIDPIIGKLGINNEKYVPAAKLADLLKMNRYYFASQSEGMQLISELKNITAKVDKEIEKSSNDRGNRTDKVMQVCKTNVREKFVFNIPTFKGSDAQLCEVELYFEPEKLEVQLVSPELNEMLVEGINKAIDEEIDLISEIYNDLIIIEI